MLERFSNYDPPIHQNTGYEYPIPNHNTGYEYPIYFPEQLIVILRRNLPQNCFFFIINGPIPELLKILHISHIVTEARKTFFKTKHISIDILSIQRGIREKK